MSYCTFHFRPSRPSKQSFSGNNQSSKQPITGMANSGTSRKHVAVLTFPFATHPGLLLRLLRRIVEAAPDVTFSFYSSARSNKALFAGPCPDNIRPFDVHDGTPEGFVFGNPIQAIELFLKVAAESFKGAIEKAEADVGERVSCLLTDAFLWFAAGLAEEISVPWVPVWTSGAFSLSTHFYTDLIRDKVGLNGVAGRENEIINFVPGFPAVRIGDLQEGIVSGNFESPFSVLLHKMGQVLPKAAAVPVNSFEELDPEINIDLKSKLKNVLNVGPFNLTSPPPLSNSDEHGCIPWLNKQKIASVAYIGFGTVVIPPPHELVALAEALEETGTPFLWSLKDSAIKLLPDGFLERAGEKGKVVPWAPQLQILAHSSVGVFINHCGWNSVLESIAAGVPIIGRPFFGDHHIDTWMVESIWKIGVRLNGGVFTKSGTINALQEVLSGETGKKLKEQIEYYKDLALKAVEPEGSSTKNFKVLVEIVTGRQH